MVSRSSANAIDQLTPPNGPVRMVLDTDTYNEIDDQFALVYALLTASLDIEAVYAAPFYNHRSADPADGMEKSYDEILRLLELFGHSDSESLAYRGATEYLSSGGNPTTNPATEDLIQRAGNHSTENPLYVVSIGAPTNVASALERAPEIAESVVVVWLGGHPHSWHTASEFNLEQDIRASQILFDSGVPLVQIPCKNVAEHIRTSVAELDEQLSDGGELAEYLLQIFTEYGKNYDDRTIWTKEIWDLAPISYLVNPEWVPSHLTQSPILSDDARYSFDRNRHLIRVAADTERDLIFEDFFQKIKDR
ncbi:nucleoside hydrolase [Haladaptatus sp. CMAA 1911]|uniref:nucleoside hydrolase n=1 Tax=unclassified Haladaptatus TaxID=2622732 RepID=UPI0037547190